jgi:hypothetical protein
MSWDKEKHEKHGADQKCADSIKKRLEGVCSKLEEGGYRLATANVDGQKCLVVYHDSLNLRAGGAVGPIVHGAIVAAIPCNRVDL